MDTQIQKPAPEGQYGASTKLGNVAETMPQVINNEMVEAIVSEAVNKPSEEEQQMQERLESLYAQNRVSLATPYPEERCLLKIDNVPFFPKGDISAVKAKQKSGKTNLIAIYTAAMLKGYLFRLQACEFGAKVLIIDTEQKPADTQTIYRKIVKLAELPEEDNFDRLQMYTLRTMSPTERQQAVKDLIKAERPDIVFLDGIVDLSIDFNEVTDSQELINTLMHLSTEYDCAIVNILHTNKAESDHNMRGHLGTMLSQKAGNVFECIKTPSNIIRVKSSDSRHAPVPEWAFTFGDDGSLECADERALLEEQQKARDKAEQLALERTRTLDAHLEYCRFVFAETVGFLTMAQLKKEYAEKAHVSTSTARTHILDLKESGRLIEEDGVVRLATYAEMHADE